jgi:4-amino-4-deoxy-L-arabinose transferase-like glycosyltransferase
LQRPILAKRAWFILFIVITAFYLWGLGSLPLVGPDEPRYAQVAREMLMRRDFITPTLGGLPWFEKPPLLYWMMMLSYRVLGVNEYAARLGPALCGLLTAVFIYLIGSALGQNSDRGRADDDTSSLGRWSALVWLSSLGAIGFSRGATFDIVLTMTISAALACFFVAEITTRRNEGESSSSKWLLVAFYFFIGLSLLAKGLIGFVIIFGVIGFYFVLRREWPRNVFLISLIWGVPLSCVAASVWYGPMIAKHGSTFIDQFIIQQHFARFTTNKYHHPGPFYFYLPWLAGMALPWTIVLLASLLASRRWKWRGDSPLDLMRVFALAWLAVPVVFFSFSGSKLAGYVLPVLPAVAILVGERIDCFARERRGEKVLRLTGVLLIVAAVVVTWYAREMSGLSFLATSLAALALVAAGASSLLRPLGSRSFVVIIVAVFLTAAVGLKVAGPFIAKRESIRDLLAAAAARGYSNSPVTQLHTVERGAEFYAAGRISYGSDGEPIKFEGAGQVLEAARRNGGSVLCLVPIQFESQLTTLAGADSEVVSDNGFVALVLCASGDQGSSQRLIKEFNHRPIIGFFFLSG